MSSLKDELEQNGIAVFIPELIEHEEIMAELDYALRPIVHEGKIRSYGFIVCTCTDSPIYHKFPQEVTFDLNLARKLADGCHSFVVFTNGQFKGVFPLQESANNELRLVQLQQSLKAIICITDITGTTKIFCDEGVFIHQYRRWQHKPSINQALYNISQCVYPINHEILQEILAFCFYELSPNKIGSTLVWCLKSFSLKDIDRLLPNPSNTSLKAKIKLNICDAVNRAILRHILTYTDGAIFIDEDGLVFGGGAHLKYSEESRHFIPAYHGTRHTSAKRFSFDFPETVLFVVSSDGLVTVFSDGMNIVNLQSYSTDSIIHATSKLPSETQSINSLVTKEELISCQNCNKTFKLQITEFVESQEHKISCPVCGNFLCLTQFAIIGVYVVKSIL